MIDEKQIKKLEKQANDRFKHINRVYRFKFRIDSLSIYTNTDYFVDTELEYFKNLLSDFYFINVGVFNGELNLYYVAKIGI